MQVWWLTFIIKLNKIGEIFIGESSKSNKLSKHVSVEIRIIRDVNLKPAPHNTSSQLGFLIISYQVSMVAYEML